MEILDHPQRLFGNLHMVAEFRGEWRSYVPLAPPSEYDWTVYVRRWCGLSSNYFDYLLLSMTPNLLTSRDQTAEPVFSERELTFMRQTTDGRATAYEVTNYMLSPVRRLSSVTFVHPTQPVEIFGNIYMPFGSLTIHRHPWKILRRSSHGNPSVGDVKRKRGGQI